MKSDKTNKYSKHESTIPLSEEAKNSARANLSSKKIPERKGTINPTATAVLQGVFSKNKNL